MICLIHTNRYIHLCQAHVEIETLHTGISAKPDQGITIEY